MSVQPLSLTQSSRIAVENITIVDIGLGESRANHVIYDPVRDKLSLVHQAFGGPAQVCSSCDVIAQNIASGDLRDVVAGHQALRLRSLAYARSAQKKDRPGQEMV